MPQWWDRLLGRQPATLAAQPLAGQPLAGLPPRRNAISAAATNISDRRDAAGRPRTIQQEAWQREAWDFYDTLGEYRYAIDWKANMVSRVRLKAARLDPEMDEPEIVDEISEPAVQFVTQMAGDINGQAELTAALETYLGVPGEGYLIGETQPGGQVSSWQARSVDELRVVNGVYQVIDEMSIGTLSWRPLGPDHLVTRVWRPHKRWYHLADSPSRSARSTMREIELVNRHIQAQYLSRLASAGLVLFPEEITFPVREEFQDAADPFMLEWIEVAAEAIKTPGTAAAMIPIPIRADAELLEKIRHIDFTLKLDEKIIEKREAAIKRLAAQLDVPPEIMLGMSDLNHWTSWQIEESAVKAHIIPDVETICGMLTAGYLRPRLKAAGEDPVGWVVWYDASEIILRPDRSQAAFDAYDRHELTGEALRREIGFDEADKPTPDQVQEQALLRLTREPQVAMDALAQLRGETPAPPAGAAPSSEAPAGQAPSDQDEQAPPDTRDEPPPPAGPDRVEQAGLMHTVRFTVDGGWSLLHPRACERRLFGCPVTHATHGGFMVKPGRPGYYELWLSATGQPVIGRHLVNLDPVELLPTLSNGNGHGHGARR